MATQSIVKAGQKDIVREGYFDLSPRSLGEAIQLAELMAKSELIPPQFRNKPGDVLIAVQYGAELGLKPLQAMQGIAVINGRPTIWGDAALGIVLQSGMLENYKEMTFEEIKKAGKAVFWGKRKGLAEPIIREFSLEDAKKAGLLGKKGPWTDYELRMMQMRARAFGLRDGWADVLKGLSMREEIDDIPPTDAPAVLAMPRRMSERQIEAPKLETAPISDHEASSQQPQEYQDAEPVGVSADGPTECPKCGSAMTYHPDGKFGPWWSCSAWRDTNCDGKISLKKWRQEHPEREPGQEG